MPFVTVCRSANGLPMASAMSPTLILSLSVKVIGLRSFASTLITAMSLPASEPILVAFSSVFPSASVTVISSA